MAEKNILAFDVSGICIKAALVSEAGEVLARDRVETPGNKEDFYAAIWKCKEQYASCCQLSGAAFSLPGAVDGKKGCVNGHSALPYIHGFNLQEELEKLLDLPVSMENDAVCAAFAEAWLGAAQGYRDVIFLICEDGVGGAILRDGYVHPGRHLHGGEFGYTLAGDGYEILSDVASASHVARKLAAEKGVSESDLTWEVMFGLAESGDIAAMNHLEEMYNILGRVIYNLQYVYDPDIFVLGGMVPYTETVVEQIQGRVDYILQQVKIAHVRPLLVPSFHSSDAGILGAVCNFLQQGRG